MSFLFSYLVCVKAYSFMCYTNKVCFVLIGFGMFPTLFCTVALRTGGVVLPRICETCVKSHTLALSNEASLVAR